MFGEVVLHLELCPDKVEIHIVLVLHYLPPEATSHQLTYQHAVIPPADPDLIPFVTAHVL